MHLRNLVQCHDPDRYLLSLFVPARHRSALWALFAFNHEIAKTREVVTDTTMGLIRLQWWRDAIAEIYEGKSARQHEVVQPLAQVIRKYDLPRESFDNLIYAREFDLEGIAPADVAGLINYCEFTSAPLFDLSLSILGQNRVQAVGQIGDNDTMIVDISKRFALIGLMRSVPYLLSQRRVLFPKSVLSDFSLSEDKLFDIKRKMDISNVVKTLVVDKSGGFEVRNAPSFMKKVNHMTELYEAQLKSVNYDVFNPRLSIPPKFMALRLWLGL